MDVQEYVKLYKDKGTIRAVARCVGGSFHASRTLYKEAVEAGLLEPRRRGRQTRDEVKETILVGRVKAVPTSEFAVPPKGTVRRYILTCAQNNTSLHLELWENLLALARHYDARVMVSRFVYDKRSQSADLDKKVATGKTAKEQAGIEWDPRVHPHLADDRVELAPGLVWCGEMNILPTAVRPLSGLEAYTGRKSSVVPHVKLAMVSVPSGKYEATKFVYTTGTVTQRNYIQRKEGLKAEFHHCYGALLVEVDGEGDWFVRQLNADSCGTLHDLDLRVEGGVVTTGNHVEAISWGDIHAIRLNKMVEELAWGHAPGQRDFCMEWALKPRYQFMHDLLDFRARNHHEIKDPHKMFKRWAEGEDSVYEELHVTFQFLKRVAAEAGGEVIVVDSNHDNALKRWVNETSYKTDPGNALIFLALEIATYKAMLAKDDWFHLLEWAEVHVTKGVSGARFLREDESFIICPDANGGIECGMHGHLGPNGSRGGATSFARMGRKAVVGHTHQAGITDGVYVAGTSSDLDLEYNKGPGSWSHSHVVTYPNGKRAIITMWNGKWRAV